MKYYKVDNDLNPKVVGSDYPQSWQFTKEYKKRMNNSDALYALYECLINQEHPDFIPDLDGFVLSGRAKLTNFVSAVAVDGMFLDEKAKQVLEAKCNLGDHEFYEATLYVRKEPKRFYNWGLFNDICSYVEFNKCGYVIYGLKSEKDLPEEWISKPIESLNDLFNIEKQYSDYPSAVKIECNKIVLKKTFDKQIDIFYNNYIFGGKYGICSERFKNAVEEAGLTGLVFEPIEVELEE